MPTNRCDLAIVGLGALGRSLLANVAGHGFTVAGYDDDPERMLIALAEKPSESVVLAGSMAELVASLRAPRAVLLLLPGTAVDAAIQDLLPFLQADDVVIDGSNSHFRETNLRGEALAQLGLHLLGTGIAGGEGVVRRGPALMPGGAATAYERVRPILEAIATRSEGLPCVAYMGIGSAGHYVKMIHDGVEAGMLRLIAESYDFMKWGLALTEDELRNVYATWEEGELSCHLLEIAGEVSDQVEAGAGRAGLDVVIEEVRRGSTGRWAAQDALELGSPAPTIAVAVAMRDMARLRAERIKASEILMGPERLFHGNLNRMLNQLRNALYASMILVLSEGLSQLRAASAAYGYGLNLSEVARVWQGGTIRSTLLRKVRVACHARPDLSSLLVDAQLGWEVMARQTDLRAVVRTAAGMGISVPALSTCLGYYDAYRTASSPADLIEAQGGYLES